MDFKECLFSRRSIRKFTDEVVSDEVIKNIITAGMYAPSACNFEAWKFIVIKKNTKNRDVLRNKIALSSPYGILVVYRNDLFVTGRVYNDYCQSAAAAIENMLLYINSIKLGAVWICDLPKSSILKKTFGIPKNFDVIGYIAFGHPSKSMENSKSQMIYHYGDLESFVEHKRRFSLEQVMCNDSFYVVDGDCTHTRFPKRKDLFFDKLKKKVVKFLKRK